MTPIADADLTASVKASASMLGLTLDEQGTEAVRDVVRSMQAPVALVLDHDPKMPDGAVEVYGVPPCALPLSYALSNSSSTILRPRR